MATIAAIWPRCAFTVASGVADEGLEALQQLWVQEGDMVTVIDQPSHGLTAGTMFRALTTEPALLPLLLEVDGLPGLRAEPGEQETLREARVGGQARGLPPLAGQSHEVSEPAGDHRSNSLRSTRPSAATSAIGKT